MLYGEPSKLAKYLGFYDLMMESENKQNQFQLLNIVLYETMNVWDTVLLMQYKAGKHIMQYGITKPSISSTIDESEAVLPFKLLQTIQWLHFEQNWIDGQLYKMQLV